MKQKGNLDKMLESIKVNQLAVYGLLGVIIILIIIIIIACKTWKSLPRDNETLSISKKEIKVFQDDSISIQPQNGLISKQLSYFDVMLRGQKQMRKDKYRLTEGVDFDGISSTEKI